MQQKLTGSRVTVRLTQEDERAIRTLRGILRPRFTLVNTADIVRAALQEAERALSAEHGSRA
jgi:hypothetical protein